MNGAHAERGGVGVSTPSDPIAAVTHADPYPYYAELVARRPIYRDEALGLWVAADAAAVTAVLTSEATRVRPPAEPVPRALVRQLACVGIAQGLLDGGLAAAERAVGEALADAIEVAA